VSKHLSLLCNHLNILILTWGHIVGLLEKSQLFEEERFMKDIFNLSLLVFALLLTSCSQNIEAPAMEDWSIYVYTVETDEPVQGANVFDNETNELLATTGNDGYARLKAYDGQVVRIVEPDYGQQQAILTYSSSDVQAQSGPNVVGWYTGRFAPTIRSGQ
jgi:hypothetical protein